MSSTDNKPNTIRYSAVWQVTCNQDERWLGHIFGTHEMHSSIPPTCVPGGNRNTVMRTNRNWLDIVESGTQILEIPGWKTLALTSLEGQDWTALEHRRSGGTGRGEIYNSLSLQTNFLEQKSVYTSKNYRRIRKQKVLKPIRLATSVCLHVTNNWRTARQNSQRITKICHGQTPTLVKIGQRLHMHFCAQLANHSPVTGRIIIGAKHAWKNAVEETHILCALQFFRGP